MCRWLVYKGDPIFMDAYVTQPQNSLITQSHHASHAKTEVNGDGLGVGWYNHLDEPGLFRDTSPAWSNANLVSLCKQIRSGLFFAHVRASTGTAINQMNCHPFVHRNWMFMHNGQIGQFIRIRREIESLIPDEFYAFRQGTTDTEAIFLAILGEMYAGKMHQEETANQESDNPVTGSVSPIEATCNVLSKIVAIMRKHQATPLRFTATLSNGKEIFAFRIASDEFAPSLYYCHSHNGAILASEPLNCDTSSWNQVPAHSVVTLKNNAFDIQPIELDTAIS